ncbi:MAG: CDP-glycerol glycerophosphotransferase family protein [Lachnospiraceae bacterium]
MNSKPKKIVLYNTHLGNLIAFGNQALDKLQYVFSYFKKREDIVLLWRPHPLSEETLNAMNPEFLGAYRELERQYKEEQIGIFDDSADLHRALTMADAYIGDYSSLLPMFSICNKPAMILDVHICKNDYYKELNQKTNYMGTHSLVSIDNITYAFSCSMNGLFQVDFDKENMQYIGSVPGEKTYEINLYSSMVAYHDKLVLVPLCAKTIAVYDTKSKVFSTYHIPKMIKYNMNYSKQELLFSTGIQYKESIYLLPCYYDGVLKFDVETGEATKYTECIKQLRVLRGKTKINQLFRKDMIIVDSTFYVVSYYSDIIMSYDMDTQEFQLHSLEQGKYKYNHMCYDGEDFWIVSSDIARILRWNIKTGQKTVYDDFPLELPLQNESDFEDIVYYGGDIWLIPSKNNCVVRLERTTGKMDIIKQLVFTKQPSTKPPIYWEKCWYITHDSKYLYLLSSDEHELLRYNASSDEVTTFKFEIPWDIIETQIDEKVDQYNIQDDKIYQEFIHPSLHDFVEDIMMEDAKSNDKNKSYDKIFVNSKGNCGDAIFQTIMKKICI